MHQEIEQDIFEVLKATSESYRSGPSEGTLKQYAKILSRYHHPNLFRFLWKLPSLYGEFPSKTALEAGARKSLGLEPLRGLSEELIDKHSEQLLKEGLSPEKVAAGERFLKASLGIGLSPPKAEPEKTVEDFLKDVDITF